MRRPFVARFAGRQVFPEGPDTVGKRPAKRLELHDLCLLLCDDLVELVEQMVLLRKPRLEVVV